MATETAGPMKSMLEMTSNELLFEILSFLVPTAAAADARKLSSLLFRVSPRFGNIFLQCLKSISRYHYSWGTVESDQVSVKWAKHHKLKVGSFTGRADSKTGGGTLLRILKNLDMSDMTELYFTESSAIFHIRHKIYSHFAQSSALKQLTLSSDMCSCKGLNTLLACKSLTRITWTMLGTISFQEIHASIEAIPSLEFLELRHWKGAVSLKSASLQVLNVIESLCDFDQLLCPCLKRLMTPDAAYIVGKLASDLLLDAIRKQECDERDEFGLLACLDEDTILRTLVKGAKAIDSANFEVAPDCHIIVSTEDVEYYYMDSELDDDPVIDDCSLERGFYDDDEDIFGFPTGLPDYDDHFFY